MCSQSITSLNSLNLYNNDKFALNFRANLEQNGTVQAATAQTGHLENDEFVSANKKKKVKKSTKRLLTLGATVAGMSFAVVCFNPRVSSKLIQKLKDSSANMNKKMKANKDKILASKFYKKMADFYDWSGRAIVATNNINSVKDTYFMKLCCEEKSFMNIRNKSKRNILQKADSIFRKIFKKPHELITKWGDDLAKATVKSSYRKSVSKANKLDDLILQFKSKLSVEEQILLDVKLNKLKLDKAYLSDDAVLKRLAGQEDCMTFLNADVRGHFQRFQHGFRNHHVDNVTHFNNNLSFWAEDMLKGEKEKILASGNDFLENLLGKKSGEKSGYKEIIDLISPKLDKNELAQLNKHYNKFEKQLMKANKNECFEYFDKKRDLVLGSAPTDIVTALGLMGLSGIGVLRADSKDEKISKVITGVLPVAAGVLVSVAMTSLLYSGIQGMLIGVLSSVVLGKVANVCNNLRLKAKGKTDEEIEGMEL